VHDVIFSTNDFISKLPNNAELKFLFLIKKRMKSEQENTQKPPTKIAFAEGKLL